MQGASEVNDLRALSNRSCSSFPPYSLRCVLSFAPLLSFPPSISSNIPDSPSRLPSPQWIWSLQPDIFHFAETDFDGNRTSFLDRTWHGIPYFYSWCRSHEAAAATAAAVTASAAASTPPPPPVPPPPRFPASGPAAAAAAPATATTAATSATAATITGASTCTPHMDSKRHYVVLEELLLERQIVNILGCEGSERVLRPERMATWAARLEGLGFRPLQLPDAVISEVSQAIGGQLANGFSLVLVGGTGMRLVWGGSSPLFVSSWTCGPPRCASVQPDPCSD